MSVAENFSPGEVAIVSAIVDRYKSSGHAAADALTKVISIMFDSGQLSGLIHSKKARAKDPDHLADKLYRKLAKAKEPGADPFDITPDNLFEKVTDLAGVRLLHLHTSQFPEINSVILSLLDEERYTIVEGPEARTWDDEYRDMFAKHGIKTVSNKRLYTSVHYIVSPNAKTKRTAEIQVRTLAEELWGEVDHSFNYPHPTNIHACGEQIKVLARLTSSCTRLVDSIYASKHESGAVKEEKPA